MSLSIKPKKLKSTYSLETNCTLDDPIDSSIKIKVFSPKMQKELKVLPASTSIKELDFQEETTSPKNSHSKNLMEVPVLCRKQHEITMLQGSGYSDPIQSQRLRASNKNMTNGFESFTESIDFKEMVINNSFRGQQTERPFYNSQKLTSTIKNQSQKREELILHKDKDEKKFSSSHRNGNFQNQATSGPRPKITSQQEDLLKKANSSGKLMMKDYIYMVDASRRHSRQRVSESREKPSVLQRKKIHPPKVECTNGNEILTRKEAIKEKYKVSNTTMLQILKEDVQKEIYRAENALKKIDRRIREGNIDPDNEQLLMLYNLRRNLKEQVNKTLDSVLHSMNIRHDERIDPQRMQVQMTEGVQIDELIKSSIRK